MGRKQLVKAILFLFGFVPFLVTGQNYPRFELYQLKQGTDSGQFIVTGLDSNLAFNNILRFRSADSTLLIGLDTVAVKSDIISSSFIFDAGLGIEIEQDGDTYLFESLSIEDSIQNQTGTLIEKGTPLYATGVQGNYWTVAPADASDPNKMPVVVIAGEDIADGETGLGLIKGHIKQVNTTGLADGAEVYVASGGGYTSTKPTAEGVIIQRLGTVIKGNSANGSGIINLGDEAYWNDYVDRTELGDSLALFLKTEVDGSVTNELQTISTSGAAGNISLSNGGGTLNLNVNDADASTTNEIQTLSYNPSTDVISISGGNSIDITEVNQNQNITLSGDATGSGTTAITVTVVDDSHNHIIGNVDGLQTALNSKLETEVDGSVTNEGSLTVGAGTASTSVISSNTSGSTDVTLTAGTNITLSETGNNITIAASGGGSSLWSEGATAGEIYYNSGNVGIGLTDPEYPLHVSGRGYFTDDLRAYDRIYLGGDFNHTSGSYAPYIDRYAASGETGMDFYAYNSGANVPLFRFRDSYDTYREVFKLNSAASTYQIIADGDSDFNGAFNIDGNLTQSGTIVQDGGTVTFNNTQSASYDFGVGSLNHLPFMWVDASADKMAVGGGTPQYTLDVTGDINFTGDLYDDGSLVSFTGTTINNNAANSIISGSNTANTLEAYANINVSNFPEMKFFNATTGNTSTDGTSLSLLSSSPAFVINNLESNGSISLAINNSLDLIVKSDGSVQILDLSGVSDVGADANGVLQAATSDTTLKTNILPNQYGLKKVMDLETIKFNWKDKESKGSQKEVGFNAQNLQKVIPEATYTIPSNGKLGIKDDAIIATLTKAIQEQQEMIEELQKEIKKIKRKIK